MPHKTARSLDITSPVIRGAYFFVHEKRTKDGNKQPIPPEKQRYEFVGLIPKTNADPTQCANYRLFADLAMTAVTAQTSEWGGQFPAGGNWPIKDGDLKAAQYPWQAGNWVIKFSANFPPKVAVLQNGQATEIPARRIGTSELYKSGDYCIVSTYAFTYDDKAKGVKFDMQGVLFVGAGEPIGATQRTVASMFGTAAGMVAAPASPPAATAPQYAPAAPMPVSYAPPAAPSSAPMAYATPPAPPAAPVAAAAPPIAPGMPPMPPAPAGAAPGMPPLPGVR